MSRKLKRIILALTDVLLIGISFSIAHVFLHFTWDGFRLFEHFYAFVIAVFCHLVIGSMFKIFSRINRYIDDKTLRSLLYALVIGYCVNLIIIYSFDFPQRIRFITLAYIFIFFMLYLSRLAWSFFNQKRNKVRIVYSNVRKTLVIGAGEAANILFKSLEFESEKYKILGVLDDSANKIGNYFHDVRVLGKIDELPEIVKTFKIDHIILAIPSLGPERLEEILEMSNESGVTINRMPRVQAILTHGFEIDKLRDVDVTDLLGRAEVKLDTKGLHEELAGKVLLITGAGGSIGSEICRQLARFNPKSIVLVGHGENSIYQIHRELQGQYKDISIIPIIADVQDRKKMFEIMQQYQPYIVYHAAAHKHVPLMEVNPIEAVKNNVYGTKNVAEAAKFAQVSKFIMISTDKAVNPPNVMGSTKRIAEMIVTGLNETGKTKFSAVRFGNVLGSRGSVIPLFKEQIAKGGPVTVTDFRMIRYFMTIPEASRLVVQAGALSEGGEVFILDMGAPVKIYDLAKKLVKLSGFTEEEIKIVETGIRPGEKLFEELLLSEEETNRNVFEKIFVGKVVKIPIEYVVEFVDALEDNAKLKEKLIWFANNDDWQQGRVIVEQNEKSISKFKNMMNNDMI